jgi:hypothetical protein
VTTARSLSQVQLSGRKSVGRDLLYGRGSTACGSDSSAANEADRRPALLREFLPASCTDGSRRTRFPGRATTLPLLLVAELGAACLALVGGFFVDMDGEGDGDGREEFTPLV